MRTVHCHLILASALGLVLALPACGKKEASDEKEEKTEKAGMKADDMKADDMKVDDMKVDDMKVDDMKVDDMKVDDMKADDMKADDGMKPDEPKADAAPAGAGPAYFGVSGVGLVKLEAGKLEIEKGVGTFVRDIAVAPDGAVYVAGIGVHRIHQGKVTKIGDSREIGASVNAITVAPNGTLYAASFKGVAAYDGKTWTMTEKDKLGGAKLLYDVVADRKNRVFVATPDKLWMLDGGAWKAIDHAKATARKPFFEKLAVGPDGSVYATFMEGVMRWAEGEITVIKPARFWRAHSFGVDAKGRVIAAAYNGELKIFGADGKEERTLKPAEAGFKARFVRGLALDSAGRIWLQTDFGVVILDAELKATQWEPGTFRELAGEIQVIAVVGGGPALPKAGPKIAGDLKGKVLKAGKPVGNVDIEICESPSSLYKVTPCSDAIYKQAGKTAPDGTFEFKGVPVGRYRFAIKAGPKWTVTFGGDCCTKLGPDSPFDIGAIQLK